MDPSGVLKVPQTIDFPIDHIQCWMVLGYFKVYESGLCKRI